MALSLQDLDSLLADPTVGAIHGAARNAIAANAPAAIPSLPLGMEPTPENMARNDFTARQAQTGVPALAPATAAPKFQPTAIPSLGAAPDVGAQAAPDHIPTLGGDLENAASAPVAKPKESVWKKLEHGLATAGNVAGDIVAPGTMALIPGTQLHNEFEQTRAAKLAGSQAETGFRNAETQNLERMGEMVPWTNPQTGETTEVPERFVGALEGAGVRAGTQEDIANKRNATQEDIASRKKQDAIIQGYAKMGYNATFNPDGTIADVQPIQGFKPPAATKEDTFHEWLDSHPNGTYDDFQKDVQAIKKMAGPSGMSIYGLSRMMNMAYEMDPRLIPILPSLMTEAGIKLPPGMDLSGPAPGQPRDASGRPIGRLMPESPTGATRSRGQFAQAVTDQIPGIRTDIEDLRDQLGPLQGRWNEFLVGKVGADNPQYFGLKTDLTNLATAWMRLHANSEGAREDFERILSTAKSPDDLVAALGKIDKLAQDYVRIGGGNQPATPGGAGAVTPPHDADEGMKWQHRTVDGKVEWRQVKQNAAAE